MAVSFSDLQLAFEYVSGGSSDHRPTTRSAYRGRFADSSLDGSGCELPVPRCALIANGAALVAPPDSVVSGGSLNGRLTTPIGWWAGNCSADPPRGSIGPTRTRPQKPW